MRDVSHAVLSIEGRPTMLIQSGNHIEDHGTLKMILQSLANREGGIETIPTWQERQFVYLANELTTLIGVPGIKGLGVTTAEVRKGHPLAVVYRERAGEIPLGVVDVEDESRRLSRC